jgi:GAF domain-containing protein
LVVAARQGWQGESVQVGTHLPASKGLAGHVAATGQVTIVDGSSQGFPAGEEALYDRAMCALALAPMRAGGQVVGVLSAGSYAPHTFTAEEIDLLSAMSGIFGVAVENARLYEEVRSNLMQLAYFNEVGSALTASLDLEQVLQVIMEGVTSLIGAERASIFLIDEATDDLVLEYSADVRERIPLSAPWPGIVGWIAINAQPAIVADVQYDPRFLPDIDAATGFDTRSILGAPLKLDERVIGVIEVLNKRDGPFTPRDQDLLVNFSKWAAIALHNARLYQELDEARERLVSVEAIALMGSMAVNLAHKLSNRIGIIPVNVKHIQDKCQAELHNPYLKEKLGTIRRAGEESLGIIRSIRGPLEVANEEPVNLSDCLAEALRGFQRTPYIVVTEKYQADLPPVQATREKLVQCFCHVIGNALDAIGEKGQLWLRTRRRVDGLLEAIILDDGPGIPHEAQAHLFELFFTTKADRGGLGLGLWWTHVYISRLGGQVKVRSTPGQGTVISIRLPVAQEKSS